VLLFICSKNYLKNMKNIILKTFLFIIIMSCGSGDKGELVGVKGKKYFAEKPFGMTLIPGGSFIMGKSDDDLVGINDAPTKTVTVRSFYMDETEITNSEYRQFVYWVRDSIIRTKLAEVAEYSDNLDEGAGIAQYAYKDADTSDLGVYQKWKKENTFSNRPLNWDVDLTFDRNDYPDEEYLEVIEGMFIDEDEVFNNVRTWDVSQFKFDFKQTNVAEYVEAKELLTAEIENELTRDEINQAGGLPSLLIELGLKRSDYIRKAPPIEVYPDTTVWIKDFKYSYNEPMHNDYFWHDAYNDYPVVGITWNQASAFCEWRTAHKNAFQKTKNKNLVPKFRLPTEAEWEYAARGGLQGAMFPWGGPYTKNDRGCFMANFKPMRGDYAVDQALYTVEGDAYDANDYGLFNMSGNVSEWVDSSYESEAYDFSSTMNPNVNNSLNKKKITRGGSWKDVKYYLQVSTRDYEYEDVPRSFIGFRTVHDYLGGELTANAQTNSSRIKR
jgi:formylglycine-generating enzyme required for sulfatase activity